METLPELMNGLPNISGPEATIEAAVSARRGVAFLPESRINFGHIRGAAAIGLHMHQP